jgi:hypothetical protein
MIDILGLSPRRFREKLQDPNFCDRLVNYLENLIKMDFDWAVEPDENEIRNSCSSFEHPSFQFPDYGPSSLSIDEWRRAYHYDAKSIAVCTQIHRHTATCRKKGTLCRFDYGENGKELATRTEIDKESGKIVHKRLHRFANNHSPTISSVSRSNNDIKITFTSGLENLKSMYYMTMYVAKHEDDNSDRLAMEAAWEQLEQEGILKTNNEVEKCRRLILRMNYIRQSGMQFSGAQIAAMVLNIGQKGTHYTDSKFGYVNLRIFVMYLENISQDCRIIVKHQSMSNTVDGGIERLEEQESMEMSSDDEGSEESRDDDENMAHEKDDSNETEEGDDGPDNELEEGTESEEDVVDVEISDSMDTIPTAVEDYIYRGDDLENLSIYELCMFTQTLNGDEEEFERYRKSLTQLRQRGRPWNERVFFHVTHSNSSRRWIRVRTEPCVPCVYGED